MQGTGLQVEIDAMTSIRMAAVFSLVLGLTGVTTAGVFDLDVLARLRLNRKTTGTATTAGDCESNGGRSIPNRERVIKQPCARSVHTYQRRKVKPLRSRQKETSRERSRG